MSEPWTEAGRRMLADWASRRTHPPSQQRERDYRAAILAIEAEAAAGPRDAGLREALEGALRAIEDDAGWLHDNVSDELVDGVATRRDIAREIAKTAYQARARLAATTEAE